MSWAPALFCAIVETGFALWLALCLNRRHGRTPGVKIVCYLLRDFAALRVKLLYISRKSSQAHVLNRKSRRTWFDIGSVLLGKQMKRSCA